MDKVTVRPIMHPDRPIEVSPAEAAILRARGLVAKEKPPAAVEPPKPAAGANATASTPTEGNTPS